jgi:hypothetical protein
MAVTVIISTASVLLIAAQSPKQFAIFGTNAFFDAIGKSTIQAICPNERDDIRSILGLQNAGHPAV